MVWENHGSFQIGAQFRLQQKKREENPLSLPHTSLLILLIILRTEFPGGAKW